MPGTRLRGTTTPVFRPRAEPRSTTWVRSADRETVGGCSERGNGPESLILRLGWEIFRWLEIQPRRTAGARDGCGALAAPLETACRAVALCRTVRPEISVKRRRNEISAVAVAGSRIGY